jgi:hypothetical protein
LAALDKRQQDVKGTRADLGRLTVKQQSATPRINQKPVKAIFSRVHHSPS